jgi:hypothetical protein
MVGRAVSAPGCSGYLKGIILFKGQNLQVFQNSA